VPIKPTISIVDDDAPVREAIRRLLKSVGMNARVYASAEEFLSSNQAQETVCLILDVQMSGMSGLELQQQLMDSGYRLPIIFISAHSNGRIREQAIRAGAVNFLFKPFSEEALLDAVQAALSTPLT
jgi:FixJ family two-component response regulator